MRHRHIRFPPIANIGTERRLVHQTTMAIDAAPAERFIWQGQPVQGIRFAPQDLFAVPFAALWLLMVLAILLLASTGELTEVDPLTYVVLPIFLLAGLHMLVGRFLVDRAARRRTHYYLTTQRAVIESGWFRPSRRSVSLAAVPDTLSRRSERARDCAVRFSRHVRDDSAKLARVIGFITSALFVARDYRALFRQARGLRSHTPH